MRYYAHYTKALALKVRDDLNLDSLREEVHLIVFSYGHLLMIEDLVIVVLRGLVILLLRPWT